MEIVIVAEEQSPGLLGSEAVDGRLVKSRKDILDIPWRRDKEERQSESVLLAYGKHRIPEELKGPGNPLDS